MKFKLAFFAAMFFASSCFAQTLAERTFLLRAETTTLDPGSGTTRVCVLVYPDGKYRGEDFSRDDRQQQ